MERIIIGCRNCRASLATAVPEMTVVALRMVGQLMPEHRGHEIYVSGAGVRLGSVSEMVRKGNGVYFYQI